MTDTLRHTVLYIEDDPSMIELMQVILNRGNFDLIGVTNGREGLDVMRQNKPSVVMLDLMLPDMGGWSVYQQMKADEELKDIPVIVVTARGAPIDRILGEHIVKVDVYIAKPFSPQQILSSVNKVLGINKA